MGVHTKAQIKWLKSYYESCDAIYLSVSLCIYFYIILILYEHFIIHTNILSNTFRGIFRRTQYEWHQYSKWTKKSHNFENSFYISILNVKLYFILNFLSCPTALQSFELFLLTFIYFDKTKTGFIYQP